MIKEPMPDLSDSDQIIKITPDGENISIEAKASLNFLVHSTASMLEMVVKETANDKEATEALKEIVNKIMSGETHD